MSSPLETIVPPFEPGEDRDTEELHEQNIQLIANEGALEWMLQRAQRGREAEGREAEALAARKASSEKGSLGGRLARDVGRGIVESPMQIVGGAIDAANETVDLLREVDVWTTANIPGMGVAAKLGGPPTKARIPTTAEAQSGTGSNIRAISQFLTGFAGAGKFKSLRSLEKIGPRAAYAVTALRGALAEFAAFDANTQGLSNLVQSVPALANPVNEFLAVDQESPKLVNRMKRALEGAGLGVLTDGVLLGLRTVRASRTARSRLEQAATSAESELKRLESSTQLQRERFKTLQGGTPEEPLIRLGPAETAAGKSADQAEVFINWSRIDTPDDVKAVLQKIADSDAARIENARRGKRSFQQIKLDAQTQNAWDALQNRRVGEPLGAEQAVAVRELWARSGTHVLELARQVQAFPNDVVAEVAFRKALAVHATIQEQVIAARTETARALASWRIPAGGTLDFSGRMDELAAALQGDGKRTKAIAQGVLNLANKGHMAEVDAFIYGSAWAKTAGAVRQLWYMSLLSGPHTHVRNLLSQTAVIGQQIYERKVANLIGKLGGGEPDVPDGETLALLFGAIHGFRDAFRVGAKGRSGFAEAFATGRSGIGVGKVEMGELGAFDPERFAISKDGVWGKTLSYIDAGTRLPTRALAASDEVFKSMGYRMELEALAYRQATQEMRSGKIASGQFQDRLTNLINNPDEEMQLAARMNAETVTFSRNPGDSTVYRFMRAAQRVPVLGPVVMPFTRTPYNIANYAFQRTPLAVATKSVRDDLAAGGARADLAWSRMLTGSAIMLTFADMAMRGQITGEGPEGPERETLLRTGWRPYSFKIGDRYYSYRGLEPVATSVGIAANTAEILSHADFGDESKDAYDVIIAAGMSIAQQLTSQQYMSGVSAFIEALQDPERYSEAFINRIAAAATPTGVAQVNRALLDPLQREVGDAIDAWRARTPGLSKDLPIKYDLWGRPISYASGIGAAYDLLIPIYGSRDTTEPIDAELLRLGAPIGRPPKLVHFGDGIEINLERYPEAYSRYVQLAGNELKGVDPLMPKSGAMEVLNALVTGKHPLSQVYLQLGTDGPDGSKAGRIRDKVQQFRDAAKKQLLKEFPDLRARAEAMRTQ